MEQASRWHRLKPKSDGACLDRQVIKSANGCAFAGFSVVIIYVLLDYQAQVQCLSRTIAVTLVKHCTTTTKHDRTGMDAAACGLISDANALNNGLK